LTVTRLRCQRCGTGIEGSFQLTRLSRLTREQLSFAEIFLKCRGVIREVERELDISYPTVRSRLDDLVRALGFDQADVAAMPSASGPPPERRRQILDDLQVRRISPEEAVRLLRGEEL
jgi:hypothetical protein